MCFLGIDFHKQHLVPILSVGAITISLWIISLDCCFPPLCWLGVIHLPIPRESQLLLNCLSPSLHFPVFSPAPVTLHDPHLSSFTPQHLLKSKLSWSQRPCWVFINTVCFEDWVNPPCDSSILTHWPLLQQTARWHFRYVICEGSPKMTNRDATLPQRAFYDSGWGDRNKKVTEQIFSKWHEQKSGSSWFSS